LCILRWRLRLVSGGFGVIELENLDGKEVTVTFKDGWKIEVKIVSTRDIHKFGELHAELLEILERGANENEIMGTKFLSFRIEEVAEIRAK
jgi:hypothetical protein